jgi:hypothetical protein
MKILGIGYAPHDEVDTQEKGASIFQSFINLFGYGKTKVRNNMV